MKVLSNQYGFPCKTYWYIVDKENKIYHYSDGKWRKKSLKQLRTYYFTSFISAANTLLNLVVKQHENVTGN